VLTIQMLPGRVMLVMRHVGLAVDGSHLRRPFSTAEAATLSTSPTQQLGMWTAKTVPPSPSRAVGIPSA